VLLDVGVGEMSTDVHGAGKGWCGGALPFDKLTSNGKGPESGRSSIRTRLRTAYRTGLGWISGHYSALHPLHMTRNRNRQPIFFIGSSGLFGCVESMDKLEAQAVENPSGYGLRDILEECLISCPLSQTSQSLYRLSVRHACDIPS